MGARIRRARRGDVAGMQRVRMAVRENRLVGRAISESEYVEAIETTGGGWVAELDGAVVGFAVGNARTGNIWALFVDPDHEGKGYGRRLHAAMLAWLWARGLERLWLATDPGTRAERFYERSGWKHAGAAERGEVRLELERPRG